MMRVGLSIILVTLLLSSEATASPRQCNDVDSSNNFVPLIYAGLTVVYDSCVPPPPAPAAPINFAAVDKADLYDVQFKLQWGLTDPANITSYFVEEVNESQGTTTELSVPFGDLSVSFDKFGGPYGVYQYRVKACNAGGCSSWSDGQIPLGILDPIPQMPSNFQVPSSFVTDVSITWQAPSAGAPPTRYELQAHYGADWTTIQSSAVTSAIDIPPFEDVDYRVRACRHEHCGSYTPAQSSAQRPGPATALSFPTTKVIDGSYIISWSAPTTGAEVQAYDLFEFNLINGTEKTIDLGVSIAFEASIAGQPDGNYRYRVHTCNTAGCSISADMVVVVDDPDAPSLPRNLTVPPTYVSNQIYTVSWTQPSNPGDGVACYQLEERQSGSSIWTTLPKSCLAQTFAISHSSGSYDYRVKACTDAACSCSFAKPCSPLTAEKSTRPLHAPGLPQNFNVVVNGTQVSTSWSAGPGDAPSSYNLERQTDGTWTLLSSSIASSFQDSPGVGTFHYRVSACNAAGCSAYTGPQSATILPSAPPPPTFGQLPTATKTLPANYDHVGATPGQFAVGPRGNANYVVPILTGPASGGLVPEIALSYDSQGGNGALGLGWSIQGLSAIRRCPQSYEVDGSPTRTAVQFDDEDRFCLDGQRLILTSGTYGGVGATYRTEVDTFALITSRGTAGTGPQYFTVKRRDGSISHYGNTGDSRPVTGLADDTETPVDESATVFAWAINRFQDSAGNYIDFTYRGADPAANIPGAVELLISRIDYAGNGATAPTNQILFIYETRLDSSVGHLAGASLSRTMRLKRIDSKAGSALLRSYHLGYDVDGMEQSATGLGRSIITSIQECSIATTPNDNNCFDATAFAWSKTANEISSNRKNQGVLPIDTKSYRHGDFNGDGLRDILYSVGNKWTLRARAGSANATSTFKTEKNLGSIPQDSEPTLRIMDYNADGMDDLVYLERVSAAQSRWKGRRGQMSGSGDIGFATAEILGMVGVELTAASQAQVLVADLNGDGLADLLYELSKTFYKSINHSTRTSAGFDAAVAMSLDSSVVDVDLVDPIDGSFHVSTTFAMPAAAVGDFDGDSDADFLVRVRLRYLLCANGDPFCTPNSAVPAASGVLAPGNYEADSNGTVSEAQSSNTPQGATESFTDDWRIGWVEGNVIKLGAESLIRERGLCTSQSQDICNLLSRVFITDVNVDGLADLAYRVQNSANLFVNVNDGSPFANLRDTRDTISMVNSREAQFVDINGDSWPDAVYPQNSSPTAKWEVKYNSFGSFDLPAQVLHAPAGDAAGVIDSGTVDHSNDALWADFNGDGKVDYYYIERHRTGTPVPDRLTVVGDGLYFGRSGTNESYQAQNLITRITDGHGARTDIDYAAMPQPVVYSASAGTDDYSGTQLNSFGNGSPVYAFTQAGHYLVRQVSLLQPAFALSTPTNPNVTATLHPSAFNRTTYHYAGGKIQLGGRGFLGFRKITTDNITNDTERVALNHQDYPFSGRTESLSVKVSNVEVEHNQTTWVATALNHGTMQAPILTQFVYAGDTKVEQWDLSHDKIQTTTTTTTYGESTQYGNPTQTEQVVKNGAGTEVLRRTTVSTFANRTSAGAWHLGLLETTQVTSKRDGQASQTSVRNTRFDHHPSSGLISLEVFQPGTNEWLATRYTHDRFGNVTQTNICGADFSHFSQREECDRVGSAASLDRIVSQTYDANGRYVTHRRNALNQLVEHTSSFDAWGNPLQVSDINGVLTYYRYDRFGREFFRFVGTGQWSKTLLHDTLTGCSSGSAFRSVTTAADGSQQQMCFDINGRERERSQLGFSGSTNQVETRYDDQGRIVAVSEPFAGGPSHWTYTWHDRLDRPVQIEHPTGARETFAYDKLDSYRKHSVTKQVTRERRSALGEVVQVDENPNDGNVPGGFASPSFGAAERTTTTFKFDELGQLTWTDGPLAGAVDRVTYVYDTYGRQIQIDDPDRGAWRFYYNVLGELLCRADSANIGTRFAYDKLGRMVSRSDRNGISTVNKACNGSNIETATWVYDNASSSNGYGQLLKTYLNNEATSPFVKTFSYDDYGRVRQVDTRLDGTTYTENTTYDREGRLLQYFDAAPGSTGTEYGYNTRGYLDTLVEPVSGYLYEDIISLNARNQLTQVKYGNGTITSSYTYRAEDGAPHMTLTSSAAQSQIQILDYDFDHAGRLKSRHDHGAKVSLGTRDNFERFFYDGLNRLEEVKFSNIGSVSDTSPSLVLTQSLSYDVAGRITSKSDLTGNYQYGSGGCTIPGLQAGGPHAVRRIGVGTPYCYDHRGNRVIGPGGESIQYNVTEKPTHITRNGTITEIAYDSQRQRYKRIEDGVTKYYVGAVEIIQQGGSTTYKRYVGASSVVTVHPNGSEQVAYLHKDHLGSVHTVTNELGQITAQSSFDAFGRRRNPDSWNQATFDTSQLKAVTDLGFTSHEMLDSSGLVHMNGRVYDPEIGRFLSADPFMSAPLNGQNHDRYAYVYNNPLNSTDPSGYCEATCTAIVLSVLISAAQTLDHELTENQAQKAFKPDAPGVPNGGVVSVSGNGGTLAERYDQTLQSNRAQKEQELAHTSTFRYLLNQVLSRLGGGTLDLDGNREYDPEHPDYHHATTLALICDSAKQFGCNSENVYYNGLLRYPAPMTDLQGTVVDRQILSLKGFGRVRVHRFDEEFRIRNSTLSDHMLHPGYVDRQVISVDGRIYVRSTGVGVGDFGAINEIFTAPLWRLNDQNITRNLPGLYPRQ